MFFILACLFLARRYGTSAAPISPYFVDPLVNYAPIFTRDECSNDCSCPGRSVWDIVWSCLATTFAVTWVSVHPIVPFLEESSWTLLKRRIFLMCLALLAPEVMVMWAFKQWRGAVMIRETINKAHPISCVQWTMTHAHFLQMGGFKLNFIKGEIFILDEHLYKTKKKEIEVQESVLSIYNVGELIWKQLIDFPDTTVEEIEDRSKGDALSKGVALLQITWFIIQLVARAHQHLTITEIELTTAALAGLNSIMYLFWWSKPLDVRRPIVIRTKELERQLAEKSRSSSHSENESQNDGGSGSEVDEGFRLRDYLRDSPAWVALDLTAKTLCPEWMRTICCRIASFAQAIISALATHLRARLALRWTRPDTEYEVQIFPAGIVFARRGHSPTPEPRSHDSHFRRLAERIWTTSTLVITKLFYLPYLLMFSPMVRILQSADPFSLNSFRDAKFDLAGYSDAKVKIHTKPALQLLFDEDDMRWIMSMMFYSEYAETRPLLIFSALAGAAFGSIHCAAWHFDFPSPVEQILWRTASLTIVGLCLFIIVISPVYIRFVYNKWYRSRLGTPGHIYWTRTKKTVETPPVVIYPVARLTLLILALLSLRRLPPSAFDTVVWTKFIPHI